MITEELLNKFSVALIFTSKLFSHIGDKFFLGKLYDKNKKLARSLTGLGNNALLIPAVGELLELIDEIIYLEICTALPPLQAKKHLLALKAEALKKSEKKIYASSPPAVKVLKENILDFIRQKKTVRAMEVVNRFNALSIRTVRRNLKELADEGKLGKSRKNRAMYYKLIS